MTIRIDDLPTDPVDDRWTLDKLRRAGYSWDRACRTCGDQIECYRHTTGRLLIVDEAVLTPHRCERG